VLSLVTGEFTDRATVESGPVVRELDDVADLVLAGAEGEGLQIAAGPCTVSALVGRVPGPVVQAAR
jgi:hypothetical protein